MSQPRKIVELLVRNNSVSPITVRTTSFEFCHRWSLVSDKGALAALTPDGVNAMRSFYTASSDKKSRYDLSPGKSFDYASPPIDDHFVLKPGRYTLHIEFRDWESPEHWVLKCDPIQIRITP